MSKIKNKSAERVISEIIKSINKAELGISTLINLLMRHPSKDAKNIIENRSLMELLNYLKYFVLTYGRYKNNKKNVSKT